MRAFRMGVEAIDEDQASAAAAPVDLDRAVLGEEVSQRDEVLELQFRGRGDGEECLVGFAEPIGELERCAPGTGWSPMEWHPERGEEHRERSALTPSSWRSEKDIERTAHRASKARILVNHEPAPHSCQAASGQSGEVAHELGAHAMQDEPPSHRRAAVLTKDWILKDVGAHGPASLWLASSCTKASIFETGHRRATEDNPRRLSKAKWIDACHAGADSSQEHRPRGGPVCGCCRSRTG